MTSRRDRGQAAILVLVVAAALFVSLSVATVEFGGRVIDRTRAQTAADAAALGALPAGRGAATNLAQRHGATLVSYSHDPVARRVTVTVRLGRATATAAATDAP
jgi:hypothetical protein